MKKYVFPIAILGLLLTASCADTPPADEATASAALTTAPAEGSVLQADLQNSKIEWHGAKPIGSGHTGTIAITKGNLVMQGQHITGGSFTMDVNSMTPQDQDAAHNAKLKGHLLSPDFLEAEKYPEATFEITGVKAVTDAASLENKEATHIITGNATLKGITKSVSFPAKVSLNDDKVTADAVFNIDRTDWGINYQSDAGIKDKFIKKEINLNIHLVARK
jgi:polyisoprenoid-binding protein YceI